MTAETLAGLAIGAAFSTFGEPVLIASGDWAGDRITAIPVTEPEDIAFGGRPVARNAVTLKIRADDLEKVPAGTEIDLLDAAGESVERRVVQGEPEWADSRRLTAILDTAPA